MIQNPTTQALLALKNKDFASARACVKAYGEKNPLELKHYLIIGLSDLALSDWAAALTSFTEAVRLFPHEAQLWFNLGLAQENLELSKESAASYEQSLSLNPHQGEACGNLSNLYRKMGRFVKAESMARRACALGTAAQNSLGLALGKQGKFDEAETAFQKALAQEPDSPLILANLANLAVDQLNFDAAWGWFAKARNISDLAVIRRDEGIARLLAGDFAVGWALYEARLELISALRVHPPCPLYRGNSLTGKKLLLVAEQGLGDTIQFCRYDNLLAETGAEILWVVQKPLQRLLVANLKGKVFVESDPLPEADFYVPLLSLPLAIGKLFPEDSAAVSYLKAPALLPQGKTRKIGLVWGGSPTHERDHERSIPLKDFAPLWEQIDATFYAPFIGKGLIEITEQTPVISLAPLITDFADTACLLQQFDCLITVDTAVAHLAGALGVKTYLLLPHSPDWRWGTTGTKTGWYPHLTLLRQPTYGDWKTVINQLVESLA